MGWSVANLFRPKREPAAAAPRPVPGRHDQRAEELRRMLLAEIPSATAPAERAFLRAARLLAEQLAAMERDGLLDAAGRAALRGPFALGYLFGLAAWHADELGLRRPGPEADELVIRLHQEALGPVPVASIAVLSGEASNDPAFADGMAAAFWDAEDFWCRRSAACRRLLRHVATARAA